MTSEPLSSHRVEEAPLRVEIVVRRKKQTSSGFWARIEKPAKVLSLVALPIVVAIGGWWVQRSVSTQSVNKDYVTIAVSLLDVSKEVEPELRAWAVDLLNKNAPVRLDQEIADKLRGGEAGLTGLLEGRHIVVRNRSTNLTRLIADALLRAAPEAELSVFNSGSIRIDSSVPTGELSLEVIRQILPFEGTVILVEMQGDVVVRMLEQGRRNQGMGGFLHGANFSYSQQQWRINGSPIDTTHRYKVAINDFLLTGREWGLDFLDPDAPEIEVLVTKGSMQDALANELLSRVELVE